MRFFAVLLALVLAGCAHKQAYNTPGNYIHFFTGDVRGEGTTYDWQGNAVRTFTIKSVGAQKLDSNGFPYLHLTQTFYYDNQEFITIERQVSGYNELTFKAIGNDLIGTAKGQFSDPYTTRWDYESHMPYNNRNTKMGVEVTQTSKDGRHMRSVGKIKKLGHKVGEFIIYYTKG